ncbi:MAG: hypothetical protein IMZ58_12550 [Thermoplasmata archaeon]|nr:hypothetical protein [Thermoplasmata archaeon]
MPEKKRWIKDKDHCWFCKRTKKQVVDDTYPMGDFLDLSGTDEDMIESAFVADGADIGCYHVPVCIVCKLIIEFTSGDVAEATIKEKIEQLL